MKAGIFIIALLVSSVVTDAQTLKELLYGGKLKLDSGAVIRKDDDLSTKIDTSAKKPVVSQRSPEKTTVADSAGVSTAALESVTAAEMAKEGNKPVDNDELWKDYMDELMGTLRTEVLPSKKIKNGTYSILLQYEIGIDGNITVANVSSSPENSFLEDQIKQRITLTAPQMTPLLGTNGKPRKAVKRQTIALSK